MLTIYEVAVGGLQRRFRITKRCYPAVSRITPYTRRTATYLLASGPAARENGGAANGGRHGRVQPRWAARGTPILDGNHLRDGGGIPHRRVAVSRGCLSLCDWVRGHLCAVRLADGDNCPARRTLRRGYRDMVCLEEPEATAFLSNPRAKNCLHCGQRISN